MAQAAGMILNGWGWSPALWSVESEWFIPDYSEVSMDRQLDRLVNCCVVNEPLHLVGWSMGGLLALRLAHERPEWFRCVSLLACNPFFLGDRDWPGVGMPSWSSFAAALLQSPVDQWWRFVALQLQGEAHPAAMMRQIRQNPDWRPSGHWVEQLDWLQFDARPLLTHVHVPCRVLLGGQDRLVPPALSGMWPSAWQVDVWEEVGHLLPLHSNRLQTWLNEK